jgi:hypothetical protein
MEEFKLAGIQVHSLCYEDFATDKYKYFQHIFECLGLEFSSEEIDTALQQGTYLKKVHSDDISNFVVNHGEVIEKFSNRNFSWQ